MSTTARRLRVLFLCTGNSCRSQMAEGWARQLKGEVIEARSAGTRPAGLNRLAVRAMAEAGVDITEHRSKGVTELEGFVPDVVVTVCADAHESCPTFAGAARVVHVGFDDPPRLAHAVVRAAAAEAARLAPDLPLFAGGRSFGGRMTSQAQADAPLPAVRGLAFLGFPLHPAGKPGTERAEHLARVAVPMLFVSGTRDALAELDLLKPVVASLGDRATLHLVADADHSLKVPARSGRTNAEAEALDAMANWMLERI